MSELHWPILHMSGNVLDLEKQVSTYSKHIPIWDMLGKPTCGLITCYH